MTRLRQADEDLRARTIVMVAIVATIIGIGAVLIAVWLAPSRAQRVRLTFEPEGVTPEVEQQLFEAKARSAPRQARARTRLESYALGDGGVAQIPVRRAVELVLQGRRPPEAGASAFGEAR